MKREPAVIKLCLVAGARPNFMKVAPLIHKLVGIQASLLDGGLQWKLIHTGQHYDYEMSTIFPGSLMFRNRIVF